MTTAGTDRIKVLWLIKGLSPGGAERLLWMFGRLGDHDRFDYRVAYVVPWADTMVAPLRMTGTAVHCLDGAKAAFPGWMVRLRRLLQSERFDVVHVHSPYVAGILRLTVRTMRLSQRPVVMYTEHCTWWSYRFATRWLNALTCRLDDARIAVSLQVRDSMSPRARRGVEVLIHGLPTQDFAAGDTSDREVTRRELGLAPGEVLVTTIANYRGQKAYDDLLQAARTVLDMGLPARFCAIGFGPLERQVRMRIDQLGLADSFQLLGYRSDVFRLLHGSDVFALASAYEGGPIAVLEAMAAGVPVVVTAVGFVPDVVSDGVEGFIVPPRRPDILAERIIQLIGDEELRRRMAAAAIVRGRCYDISTAVHRVEDIYLSLVANRSRGDLPADVIESPRPSAPELRQPVARKPLGTDHRGSRGRMAGPMSGGRLWN